MENKIKESKSLEIIIEEPHNFKKRNFNKNIKKTKSLFNIQNNLFKEILSKNDYKTIKFFNIIFILIIELIKKILKLRLIVYIIPLQI